MPNFYFNENFLKCRPKHTCIGLRKTCVRINVGKSIYACFGIAGRDGGRVLVTGLRDHPHWSWFKRPWGWQWRI